MYEAQLEESNTHCNIDDFKTKFILVMLDVRVFNNALFVLFVHHTLLATKIATPERNVLRRSKSHERKKKF